VAVNIGANTSATGEIESPSSKARKQGHGNKPDFMLRMKIGDKELELVNMETGRPESDTKKQESDHNRLARGAKDAFENFAINGSVKKFEYEELTKVFCLNVKGRYLSAQFFSKTREGYYHFVKMSQVEIPLFPSKPEQVYKLMKLLLELRTAIITTARMLFYRYTSRRSKKPNKSVVYGIKQ
ncbi:7538_t:CDS:2, partial [Cetraspora pellucida]